MDWEIRGSSLGQKLLEFDSEQERQTRFGLFFLNNSLCFFLMKIWILTDKFGFFDLLFDLNFVTAHLQLHQFIWVSSNYLKQKINFYFCVFTKLKKKESGGFGQKNLNCFTRNCRSIWQRRSSSTYVRSGCSQVLGTRHHLEFSGKPKKSDSWLMHVCDFGIWILVLILKRNWGQIRQRRTQRNWKRCREWQRKNIWLLSAARAVVSPEASLNIAASLGSFFFFF